MQKTEEEKTTDAFEQLSSRSVFCFYLKLLTLTGTDEKAANIFSFAPLTVLFCDAFLKKQHKAGQSNWGSMCCIHNAGTRKNKLA